VIDGACGRPSGKELPAEFLGSGSGRDARWTAAGTAALLFDAFAIIETRLRMPITALQVHAPAVGAARVGEYRGAATAASFGDPQAEFCALRDGCGAYDLGFRSKITLTGSDRARWLNGMVTNNIRDLDAGRGVYAFLLNPQGHILGDLFAYNRGESIVVDTDCSQAEKILATFDHYIIMDDVEVTNVSEQLTALGVSGPSSRDVLQAAGIAVGDLLPLQLQDLAWHGVSCTLVRGDAENDSFEIWLGCPAGRRGCCGRFGSAGDAAHCPRHPAVWS